MIGKTVANKYRIDQKIGSGGIGVVYKATQMFQDEIQREVAIKIVPALEDLKREGAAILQIDHPNVVRVLELLVDEERFLLVMELVDGGTLQQWIDADSNDALTLQNACTQILCGLEAIHQRKIAHMDLKPSNVLVTSTGVIKIGDFGLAASGGQSAMTKRPGTAKYTAPEAFSGSSAPTFDPRPDIYSAGFLLYELLLGKTRFRQLFREICADPRFEYHRWANWHADKSVPPLQALHELRPEISPELSGIIERMCAKDPVQRYSDVTLILSDLKHALAKTHTPFQPESGPAPFNLHSQGKRETKRGSKRFYYVAAFALCLTLGIVAFSQLPIHPTVADKSEGIADNEARLPQPDPAPEAPLPAPGPVLPKELSTPTGPMVLVEAGAFLTGDTPLSMELPDFFIDKYEVSNSFYEDFTSATGNAVPPDPPPLRNYLKANRTMPVVNVSWTEANDFCAWAGKHLAQLEEWEKSARHLDGRAWPWGNSPPAGEANLGGSEDGAEFMAAVDAFPRDVSPFGIFGLAGNVAEWTVDLARHRDGTLNRVPVIKGGSYTDSASKYHGVSPVVARYTPPAERLEGVGFRCAATNDEIEGLLNGARREAK